MKKIFYYALGLLTPFLLPLAASAHEVYVLSARDIVVDENAAQFNVFNALKDQGNLLLAFGVAIFIIIAIAVVFWWSGSVWGEKSRLWLEKAANLGALILRVFVGTSLLFGVATGSFFGPELSVSLFPYHQVVEVILAVSGGMIVAGLFTEVAALAGIILFLISFALFGDYMFTYISYLAEFLVLFVVGSRTFALDRYVMGARRSFKWLVGYEYLVLRVAYGLSIIYAAVNIKFFHPLLTLQVINEYDLTRFHLLFPSDPYLVVLGAGIVELCIGISILIGLEMRFTILVSLFYITLSLFFFGESVWPHLILYGMSIYLLTNKSSYGIDNLIKRYVYNRHKLKI